MRQRKDAFPTAYGRVASQGTPHVLKINAFVAIYARGALKMAVLTLKNTDPMYVPSVLECVLEFSVLLHSSLVFIYALGFVVKGPSPSQQTLCNIFTSKRNRPLIDFSVKKCHGFRISFYHLVWIRSLS